MNYSTERISDDLLDEISASLRGKKYGSVEIYIENGVVTQITERVIKKYRATPTDDKKIAFKEKIVIPKALVNKNR